LTVESLVDVTDDTGLAALQAGDIAVGYIEALGCVDCTPLRRRRRLAGSNESDHKREHGVRRRRLAPSSAILYKTSDDEAEGEEERLGFVGPYFTMGNALHVVVDVEAGHNDRLGLEVDGATRLYGGLAVLNPVGENEVFHLITEKASVQGTFGSPP